MGTWKVIGSTNRWPRVVNMWEMDGWDHWAESLERQFFPSKKDPALAPWWAKATEWRSGGFDRICEPTAYSPTCAEMQQNGFKAWVCVHSLVQLAPGKRDAYLAAVGDTLVPVLAARGLVLMGAYSVPMRSDEALLLWAAPDFRFLCRLYAERLHDPELQHWRTRVDAWQLAEETMWIVPSAIASSIPTTAAPTRRADTAKKTGSQGADCRPRGSRAQAVRYARADSLRRGSAYRYLLL
jgi:hypothetical protein